MKLIVDTNIVIAAIIKDSTTRKLLLHSDLEIYSPEYLFEELNEHKEEILKKAKINQTDFENFCSVIRRIAQIIPKATYNDYIAKAEEIIEDVDDWPFVAAAISSKCDIWTNDPHFIEKATKLFEKFHVTIWTTSQLYEFINCEK